MDITIFLEIIVFAVFLLVMKYFVPWLKAMKAEEDMRLIMEVVKQAVTAANELHLINELNDKATYAWTRAVASLKAKNITFDEEELKMYIKAAVTQLRIEVDGTNAQKITTEQE